MDAARGRTAHVPNHRPAARHHIRSAEPHIRQTLLGLLAGRLTCEFSRSGPPGGRVSDRTEWGSSVPRVGCAPYLPIAWEQGSRRKPFGSSPRHLPPPPVWRQAAAGYNLVDIAGPFRSAQSTTG